MMEPMEVCWAAESVIHTVVYILMMGYVLYRFAKPFMENRDKAFGIGIAYALTMLLQYAIPFELNNVAAYGIGVLSALFAMCMLDRKNYRQKIYIAVTFFSLRWLSSYTADIITVKLVDKIIYTAYMAEHPVRQFLAAIAIDLLDHAITFSVIGLSVRYIIKAYTYKRENMTTKELLMLIVPSVTGLTGYAIMQYYQALIETSVQGAVSGIYFGLAFLHYGISIVTIVVVTVLFQNIKAKQEDRLQNEIIFAQIDNIKRHIGQVENLYQDIRSIKHDMANHILTLERLYAQNSAEAEEYTRELKDALAQAAGEAKSGNPVTDVILQEWKTETEKKKIRFNCDFHYPTGSDINVFDVSVILNNALQNAVENTKAGETAHISVRSYRRSNVFLIEISNSFAGNLRWDTECGLPVTSKEKADSHGYRQAHGYGLSNIRKVAGKYFGDIDIVVEDGEFMLNVMLMTV